MVPVGIALPVDCIVFEFEDENIDVTVSVSVFNAVIFELAVNEKDLVPPSRESVDEIVSVECGLNDAVKMALTLSHAL